MGGGGGITFEFIGYWQNRGTSISIKALTHSITSCSPDIEDFIVIVIIEFDSASRDSMEYDEGQHGAHGEDPEYGAIFMSNSATKRECFSRRLFGLPSSQSRFVMQVKYGMILFLFEYEKRQLHGVFRACSDGAMYIEPNAFRKSGKQFPAQVWICISFLCPFVSFF